MLPQDILGHCNTLKDKMHKLEHLYTKSESDRTSSADGAEPHSID